MTRASWISALSGVLLLGLIAGCGGQADGWVPVLEESSTSSLATETQRALEHLRRSREAADDDPAAAALELQRAEEALDRLSRYYLPVLEARGRAYNAYRLFYLGERGRAGRELETLERLLLGVADGSQPPLTGEIQETLESVADARVALSTAPEEVPDLLETLAVRLHEMVLKGDLILGPEEGPG